MEEKRVAKDMRIYFNHGKVFIPGVYIIEFKMLGIVLYAPVLPPMCK
jgi:hypothetical protein